MEEAPSATVSSSLPAGQALKRTSPTALAEKFTPFQFSSLKPSVPPGKQNFHTDTAMNCIRSRESDCTDSYKNNPYAGLRVEKTVCLKGDRWKPSDAAAVQPGFPPGFAHRREVTPPTAPHHRSQPPRNALNRFLPARGR